MRLWGKYRLLLPAWRFLFFVLLMDYGVLAAYQIDDITPSPALKHAKIAVVQFLPLPDCTASGKIPHERVFTNEIITKNPESTEIAGDFVPVDYLNIINANLKGLAAYYGLSFIICQNIGAVPDDADFIVLGAVKKFQVGKRVEIGIDIRLLEGRTCNVREQTVLQNTYGDVAHIPFIPNHPIHTVGRHANNFHPQRVLLNRAANACILELIEFIDNEIR